MPSFDKRGISRNFSASSESYLKGAVVQREAAIHLTHMVENPAPQKIADLGCGPGLLTQQLSRTFTEAEILGVDMAPGMIRQSEANFRKNRRVRFAVEDMEEFCESGRFDLVASNYSLQWIASTERIFSNVHESLDEGGRFAFSVPLAGSFEELYTAYEAATGQPFTGVKLRTANDYQRLLAKATFETTGIRCFERRVTFSTVLETLESFRTTGATFRYHTSYEPLPIPLMRKLIKEYAARSTAPGQTIHLTHRYGCFLAECGRNIGKNNADGILKSDIPQRHGS